MDWLIAPESAKDYDQNGSERQLACFCRIVGYVFDGLGSVYRLKIWTRTSVCTAAIGVWSGQMLGLEDDFAVGRPLRCVSTDTSGTKVVVRCIDTH
jgi:hypothetical protein